MPTIKTPAKIDKAPKSQKARVGDTVAFKCEISGNPIPSGTWYKGKTKLADEGRLLIETAEDFSELEIENVEKADEGEYTCVVKNDFGEDKCIVNLTVEVGGAINESDAGGAGNEDVANDDDQDGDSDVDSKDLDLPLREEVHLATDKKFDDNYTSLKELGKGKFGVVKKVKEKSTGNEYAAKFLKITKESREEVLAEMLIMNKLHSKRLIYLHDAYEKPKEMIIVLELISGGELFEKVCNDDNLTEKEVVRYMKQILQGVEHMHKKRIVHLDLKPENVLCVIRPDGKEDLKLIDFGMARVLERGKSVKVACGTPEFVAPEVISYEPITLASDMWSVGVIAYVLLSGLSPFMGDDDNETIQNVSTAGWDFEDEAFDVISDLSKKFIEELLIKAPEKRNDVFQCLDHDWLKKIKTIKTQKLSTENLKKFIARRRWARTANALRALSRMGSLGGLMAGGGKGRAAAAAAPKPGGFLKKVKEEKAKEEAQGAAAKPEPKKEPARKEAPKEEPKKSPGDSLAPARPGGSNRSGRRSPALSGRRSPVSRAEAHGMPLGPPVFIQHLTNCEIIENSAARFECKVSGNPEPDVEWYKDGRLLKESKQLTFLYDDHDNCKLIITKGTAADAGEYTVVAENPHGKVSSTARLVVDTGSTDDETASESELSELSGSETEERTTRAKEEKITKYYTVQDELGKGRFGVVCKCIDNKTGRAYAAKFIKCSSPKERQDVIHEAEIMNSVRHKRLLRLQDFFQTPTEMILVMELVTGGELFEKVVEDEFISESEVSYYMKQILEGIQHMHQREILHLDLKPENIMLIRPESKQIKLIDFGLARKYNPKENLKVMFGTPEFVAPEVIKYERITPATDLWSIGVIAYILLSGLSPFMGDTDAETLTNVQLAEWDFDDPVFDEISEEAKDFISNLLVLAARKRSTVDKCLNHRWFTIKKGKKLKTDRLKAFTARRKWKRAITAIRSTNFLSRILGSRGADSDKKSSGGGGVGLLARVKAMHAAGVQSPEGGSPLGSTPFLSPASAALSTSNSFTTVTVTETKRAKGQEKTIVTTKETVTATKDGKTTVETRKITKTTRRNDDNTEEETNVNTEEVENGLSGAASTPQAIAKRYASGGLPLKLESVNKFWGIKHELARGRFSVIKRCLDAKTKKPFVAKIIKYDDDTDRDDSLQEFDIHRSIKGDKVVMLRDAFLLRRYIVLVMDLLEGQDILSFIASKPRPNEEDVCFVIRPLLDVVNYLHGQKIVHLDIRPANIFIAKSNLGLKLLDYGSARRIKNWKEGDMLAIVSYCAFTAPELLDFTPVSGGADMWSIGVLVYALLSGELPFAVQKCAEDEDEDEKIAEEVKKCKWNFDSKAFQRCTSEVKDFITALLAFKASKRPSAEEAMQHPWIQGDNLQKRRSSEVNSSRLKELSQQLLKKDKDDVVTASCVLRSFSEDPYDSPDSEEE